MTVPVTADAGQVHLGPGILYTAAVATTDPANVAAVTGSSAWTEVGYTENGTTFDYTLTVADIFVEEEFDPVKIATTARKSTLTFQMAQTTRRNLALALNIGSGAANGATQLEPPSPGTELRVKIAWLSEEGALWCGRQCIQAGDLKVARQKAPNKATFPVTFNLEKPSGAQPFFVIPTTVGSV